MRYIRKLPDVEELQKEYSLTESEKSERLECIYQIRNILSGSDKRKILIIGPCSADREDAVLDYVCRLRKISDKVKDRIYIIPRIYTSKPRTTGEGYKGLVHNPYGDEEENLLKGIIAARKLHLDVIRESKMFAADEMLYPDEIYYIYDLLCYMVVGARSVEDQGHRMIASDDSIPVGMKNPTGGSKIVLVNSIKAAQKKYRLVYRGWEVETAGNAYAHGILRGFSNKSGKNYPNYHYEDLEEFCNMCTEAAVKNPSVIVDCSHANSNKNFLQQSRIASQIVGSCLSDEKINSFVKGLMIESYIEDGCQAPGGGIYGMSITDPCLGWDRTEELINRLYDTAFGS